MMPIKTNERRTGVYTTLMIENSESVPVERRSMKQRFADFGEMIGHPPKGWDDIHVCLDMAEAHLSEIIKYHREEITRLVPNGRNSQRIRDASLQIGRAGAGIHGIENLRDDLRRFEGEGLECTAWVLDMVHTVLSLGQWIAAAAVSPFERHARTGAKVNLTYDEVRRARTERAKSDHDRWQSYANQLVEENPKIHSTRLFKKVGEESNKHPHHIRKYVKDPRRA